MRGRKKKTKSKHKIKREIGEETKRIEQELTFQPKSIKMERGKKSFRETKGKQEGEMERNRELQKNSEEQKKRMHA